MSSPSAPTAPAPVPEYRRYWHRGVITDAELWRGAELVSTRPRRLPRSRHETDYCAVHRLRIDADLPCAHCGAWPGPEPQGDAGADVGAEPAVPAPGASAPEPEDDVGIPGVS